MEKEYLKLAQTILEKGTYKPAARKGLPGTTSLFGYQMRHDLSEGFPLLTTKKVSFKNVLVELLWFLKGDTNVKWLNDNGFRLWNDDAFNYMQKKAKEQGVESGYENTEEGKKKFSTNVKDGNITLGMQHPTIKNFCYGDCGFQYGKLWRNWEADPYIEGNTDGLLFCYIAYDKIVDQLKDLIYGLKNSPEGRRHIITAWRPDTLNDMALNACHNLVQFNCRPIPWETKLEMAKSHPNIEMENLAITEAAGGNPNYGPIPQYYLDCQMYQRSADTFLGVPYNIASYALLTHILCEVLNMIPGDFIHTFGDVHIYDNHLESIKEQLERTPSALPKLEINSEFWNTENSLGTDVEAFLSNLQNEDFLQNLIKNDIKVLDYNPQGRIEGKLSTGLV